MKKLIFFFFLSLQISAAAQHKSGSDNFNTKIREEEGDLNTDGLIDQVIVSMDTTDARSPLKLQVFFGQPGKKLKLMVSTTKLILPQFPNGKTFSGLQIPIFEIENGKLRMISETGHGQSLHVFKYQNKHFELIYFSKVYWDGNITFVETDFDLVKGIKTLTTDIQGSDKSSKKTKSKVLIRPLPKIQELVAYEKKPYY